MTNSSTVIATGQLTASDIYRFYLTALLKRFWWFLGIMALTGSWFVLSVSRGTLHWEWTVQNVVGPSFVFLLVPYAFVVAPYFAAKKQVRTNPNLNGPMSYSFSDTGIEFSGPNAQAHLEWKAITRVQETSTQFLFYPQQTVAHVVPKRFLAHPEDQSALRALVRAHAGNSQLRS